MDVFIGESTLKYTNARDGESETKISSANMSDTIRFTRSPGANGNDIRILIPSPALFGDLDVVNFEFEQVWNAAGECEVLGYVSINANDKVERQVLIDGKFIPDNAALTPGNTYYNKSMTALSQIAVALNNSGFVETATSLLFPPPPAIPDDLTVKGKLPWVLFHRRRTKICEDQQSACRSSY